MFLGRLSGHFDRILARFSERRCAKSERNRDADTSAQPTTQAGEPGCSCHIRTMRLFVAKDNKKRRRVASTLMPHDCPTRGERLDATMSCDLSDKVARQIWKVSFSRENGPAANDQAAL